MIQLRNDTITLQTITYYDKISNYKSIMYYNTITYYITAIYYDIITHLQVVLWIPVRVIDDDGVGSGQVDSESAGASAEQEDKTIRVWFGESVDRFLSQISSDPSVNPLKWISTQMIRSGIHRRWYMSDNRLLDMGYWLEWSPCNAQNPSSILP